jgi:tRNA G18 (ribose-2'-O)-methylase SpoU
LLAVTVAATACGISRQGDRCHQRRRHAVISDTKAPQGMIGVYKKPIWALDEFYGEKYLLYLDGVQDAENVGP